MKISSAYTNNIYNSQIQYSKPAFTALKVPNEVSDVFVREALAPCREGLKSVRNVYSTIHETICDGAIPMKRFWKLFNEKTAKSLRSRGLSTNKAGIKDSFLKAKSNIPVSTSNIGDGAVMYLYNDTSKTHALYNASVDCPKERLDFMVETLMPEGFTHGIIVPGRTYVAKAQEKIMTEMFTSMKKHNKNSTVNVFVSNEQYPEIVGYSGQVFTIPNQDITHQISGVGYYFKDEGQASFKILDLRGENTFDRINKSSCNAREVKELRQKFKQKGCNKETVEVLNGSISKRKSCIDSIMRCKTMQQLFSVIGCLGSKDDFVSYAKYFKAARVKILSSD